MTTSDITLVAGDATATLSPEEGGMLTALRVGGSDLLVPRRTGEHPVPAFGSFVIAPWLAEMYLGELDFGSRHAEFPKNRGRHALHGLVFDKPWRVVDGDATTATLECHLDPPWPFGGTVVQRVALDADGVNLELEVHTEDEPLPAAVGWHPWWNAPDPSRIRVRVNAAHELELDDELIPTGRIVSVAGDKDLCDGPVLGDRRIDVVFVGATSPATIETPKVDIRIVFDPKINVVTVYSEPGAVCVEPWSAWRDPLRMAQLGHPSGIETVTPGTPLRRWTRWEWTVKDGPAA